MSWTRNGTAGVTNGSPVVQGFGTDWVTTGRAGEAFYGPDQRPYEIKTIDAAGQLTLIEPYAGGTGSGVPYFIVPTQSYMREAAAQIAALITQFKEVALGPGAGKFAAGTPVTPSIRGLADESSGLNIPGGGLVQTMAGGQKVMEVNSAGLSAGPVLEKMAPGTLGLWDNGNLVAQDNRHQLKTSTRDSFQRPDAYRQGVTWEFKLASTLGGPGGQYGGALTLAPWLSTTESAGGPNHQLGFRYDGAMLYRTGIDGTWGAWERVLTDRVGPAPRGTVGLNNTNFDTLLPGLYAYFPGPAGGTGAVNAPIPNNAYGFIEVSVTDGSTAVQRLTCDGRLGRSLIRTRWQTNPWSTWSYENEDAAGNVYSSARFISQPNNYGSRFYMGGAVDGSAPIDTNAGSVGTTNGNVHIDASTAGGGSTYLNFYRGTGGVIFGNGASEFHASVDRDGIFSFPRWTLLGAAGSNFIAAGADGASAVAGNVRIASWFGVAFGPTYGGDSVPVGENSHWFDTRNGNSGQRGHNMAPQFWGSSKVSTTILNSGNPIPGTEGAYGLLILRDDLQGGSDVYLMDPNYGGVMKIAGSLQGVEVGINVNDTYRWYVTTRSGRPDRTFTAAIISPRTA